MAMETVISDARQPDYGASIEALIGSRLGDIALSADLSPNRYEERNARIHPNMGHQTLRELERNLASEIASNYHCRRHEGLRSAPIDAWRNRQPNMFRAPADCLRFRLSFLPEEECTPHDGGIHLQGRRFWSRSLANHIDAGATRFTVKYDPRDLSHIFIRSPAGRFFKAKSCADSSPEIAKAGSRAVSNGERSDRMLQRRNLSAPSRRDRASDAPFLSGSAEFLENKCLGSCPFAGTTSRAQTETHICC